MLKRCGRRLESLKAPSSWYDLTPRISERLAVFPGDQSFERHVALSFSNGDHLELSSLRSTLHLGAHADAPSHYGAGLGDITSRSLARYMGLAQVIRVSGLPVKGRVQPAHLKSSIQAPRVLIDTGSFPEPEQWTDQFNAFSPELLHVLADQGVVLVGIDTPSVDPADSKALEAHQALKQRDLAVLEGLVLKGVPEGLYILVALPLPIESGDASPVRAILLPRIAGFPEFK